MTGTALTPTNNGGYMDVGAGGVCSRNSVRAELTDHLEATTSHDGDTVVVAYSGSAEGEALGPLQTLLDHVHNDAVRTSVRQVVADLRALEFASSSCLKAFVTWLQRVQELDDDRRYQILFRSNPHH